MNIKGNIPMDELAPDAVVNIPDELPLTDGNGNVIGEVTSVERNDTGLAVEAELFTKAAEVQYELASRRVDDLILAGAKNAAEILDNPNLQERTAMEAVMRVMSEREDPQERKQPGPARRKAPKVSARKRQRQARKRNR